MVALGAAAIGGWWVGREDADSGPTIVVPSVPATTVNQLQASGSGSAAAAQTSAGAIDVAAVAETVAPSVVTVSATVGNGQVAGEAVGTGVIISPEGEILTNAHVVAGAQDVRVRLAGNTEPIPATVVAVDPGNDLALLRIDIDADLPSVTVADPATIRIGDPVVAIGFALDLDGDPSVTLGIVSALDRTLSISETESLDGLIQTDAAISSGNSGGPLVNAAGQLVGINTAVAESDIEVAATNVGFAIGADEINEVLPLLREGGQRVPGFLGVRARRAGRRWARCSGRRRHPGFACRRCRPAASATWSSPSMTSRSTAAVGWSASSATTDPVTKSRSSWCATATRSR